MALKAVPIPVVAREAEPNPYTDDVRTIIKNKGDGQAYVLPIPALKGERDDDKRAKVLNKAIRQIRAVDESVTIRVKARKGEDNLLVWAVDRQSRPRGNGDAK